MACVAVQHRQNVLHEIRRSFRSSLRPDYSVGFAYNFVELEKEFYTVKMSNTLSIQELRPLFDNLRGRVDQLGRFL